MNKTAIIISASSDIGEAMARRWAIMGWKVIGTFRTKTSKVDALAEKGIKLIACDLASKESILKACFEIKKLCSSWDVLVLCPGAQEPIGSFIENDYDEWEESIRVNLTSQLRIVHELMPMRNLKVQNGPCVIFFAGGGTNDAPPNYSAYILSKTGLIKMMELLDAEVADTRFVIVGPGWVKTKIHESTFKAGKRAGPNYERTREKLAGSDCTDMETVLDCCDWLVSSPRNIISGRNFSVVFDRWGDGKLTKKLSEDSNMYKLRRFGNDLLVRRKE